MRGVPVDGVASITQRISEIHHRIATVSPPPRATSVLASTHTTATSTGLASSSTATSQTGAASFDAALAKATGSNTAAAAGRLNAKGVPVELVSYGNGRIPESALASIPGSKEKMWAPAAESLGQLMRDAKAQGVNIGVTDGYRSYDGQVRIAAKKGLYSQGGLAAVPGTSQHGWGMAVDLRLDGKAQAWMRENASKYSFVEAVAREPWHWEFKPGK